MNEHVTSTWAMARTTSTGQTPTPLGSVARSELPVRRLLSPTNRVRGLVLLLPALAAGCIENRVEPGRSSSPVASHDSGPSPDACPTNRPQDATAEVTGTCTTPAWDWSLAEKWHWDAGDRLQRDAHVGRFEDSNDDGAITILDSVQIALNDPEWGLRDNPLFMLSGTGTVLLEDHDLDGWGMYATVADADPTRLGMECVGAGLSSDAATFATAMVGMGTLAYLVPLEVDEDSTGGPVFLADLDGDGAAEAVANGVVTSAQDGQLLFTFPSPGTGTVRPVAADLDLDGLPEIVADLNFEPAILNNQGQLRATCPILAANDWVDGNMIFAIGNLDDDPEGEFAVVRPGILAICEADGTIASEVASGSSNATTIGIADLTGDGTAELIVDEWRSDAVIPVSVAAYDRKLNLLWRRALSELDGKAPLVVVDLDGDGLPEILVHRGSGGVVILSHDGVQLAEIDGTATGGSYAPIVADLDGDGLAEILISGMSPTVTVYTNDHGGWPVKGGEDPWPAIDHFPGDRNFDGTLPNPADVHWLIPGHNVWQGLESGRDALPDIGLELTDACSDDCQTTVITAYVSNQGAADDPTPVTVTLTSMDGTILASEVLTDIPSGVRRAVQFSVSTAETESGVRASARGVWAECTDVPNEAVLTELPCQ